MAEMSSRAFALCEPYYHRYEDTYNHMVYTIVWPLSSPREGPEAEDQPAWTNGKKTVLYLVKQVLIYILRGTWHGGGPAVRAWPTRDRGVMQVLDPAHYMRLPTRMELAMWFSRFYSAHGQPAGRESSKCLPIHYNSLAWG